MKRIIAIFACFMLLSSCREKQPAVQHLSWEQQGDSIIALTFDTIRNSLMRAAARDGFEGAIGYCSTEALPLTDAYAAKSVTVRRTSDKFRNPANRPDSLEQRVLAAFMQSWQGNRDLKHILEKDAAGNQHYFKPIVIQSFCLNCHGNENDPIQPATWQAIRQKYPGDLAYGYKEGDLRGLWHVMFQDK